MDRRVRGNRLNLMGSGKVYGLNLYKRLRLKNVPYYVAIIFTVHLILRKSLSPYSRDFRVEVPSVLRVIYSRKVANTSISGPKGLQPEVVLNRSTPTDDDGTPFSS